MNIRSNSVEVVDSVCGSGKTQYILKYFKNITHDEEGEIREKPERCFIFVTPYISEIKRLLTSNDTFVEPLGTDDYENDIAKRTSLNKIMQEDGANIVMTHTLFFMSFGKILNYIHKSEFPYVLVIDESPDIYNMFETRAGDIKTLNDYLEYLPMDDTTDPKGIFKRNLTIDTVAKCKLKESGKELKRLGSRYEDILTACNSDSLYFIDGQIYFSVIPIDLLTAFAEVKFLTYMFKGQFNELYLKAHGIEPIYKHIEEDANGQYIMVDGIHPYSGAEFRDLITIVEPEPNEKSAILNEIGDDYTLSKRCYEKASKRDKNRLKDALQTFYRSSGASADKFIWTTFKDYKDDLKGKGYNKDSSFCPCSARATNEYRKRDVCAYMIGFNLHPDVEKFTGKLAHGLAYDKDIYSLSALIQWLFRSAIRDGEPIRLYIPCRRMRELLKGWLGIEPSTEKRKAKKK